MKQKKDMKHLPEIWPILLTKEKDKLSLCVYKEENLSSQISYSMMQSNSK